MTENNQKVLNYIRNDMFPPEQKISDIFKTFNECSYDKSNKRFLVTNTTKAINYDLLVKRIYRRKHKNKPKTADSMTFTEDSIVFIEFRTGDQTVSTNRKRTLIKNAIDKINKSEQVLFQDIISAIENIDIESIQIAFYLVVDAVAMGIDSRLEVLLQQSQGTESLQNSKAFFLIEELLPELKNQAEHPERFIEIDMWYSDIFDTYISKYGITDIEKL